MYDRTISEFLSVRGGLLYRIEFIYLCSQSLVDTAADLAGSDTFIKLARIVVYSCTHDTRSMTDCWVTA